MTHLDGRVAALAVEGTYTPILARPYCDFVRYLDGRVAALAVEDDELSPLDIDVLKGETLGAHLVGGRGGIRVRVGIRVRAKGRGRARGRARGRGRGRVMLWLWVEALGARLLARR